MLKTQKSLENAAETASSDGGTAIKSMKNTEEYKISQKSDCNSTEGSETSQGSLEISDGVIRSDLKGSLENLLKVLEDDDADPQSPDILNDKVLDIDDTEHSEEISPPIKKYLTFGKYKEHFSSYNFAYKMLDMFKLES